MTRSPSRKLAKHGPGIVLRGLGGLLLLAALVLVASTEHGVMLYRQALDRPGGEVLDLGSAAPAQPLRDGTLVRVSGLPVIAQPPLDVQFNLSADAPVLIRQVEMLQWREVRIGDQLHYEMDWVDRPLASENFSQPAGHRNPGAFPIQGQRFEAGAVRLGGFILAPALVQQLPGSVPVVPHMDALPANLAASFSLHGNYLVTSAQPATPRLGDLRISWRAVPRQVLTVLAAVTAGTLAPISSGEDAHRFDIQLGERPLIDVMPQLPPPPTGVAVRRELAIVLGLLGGALLLWRPGRSLMAQLRGAAAGVLPVAVIGAVIWLGSDRVAVLAWLTLALLALIVLLWRRRDPR
ncbi:MAG: TMEM43 family protein [Dyella sp.]